VSQAAHPTHELPSVVRHLFAPILPDLQRVEGVLAQELRNRSSAFVDELLQYGGKLGGKRLRPALLMLSAQATGRIVPEHDTLAAVIEMIHTATLVHDDVLDEAEIRRHLATVNARWNNETSVLLGDYLFSHAFYLAATLDTTYACQRIGRSTNIVCEGELRQVGNRGNHGLTEAEYNAIINGKTAELCACACHLGAYYANQPPKHVEAMEQYGRSLGMAFQIADDLLDLLGDESTTGKTLGSDIQKQKPTLPLIRCYDLASESERMDLVALLETPDESTRGSLQAWFDRYGAVEYARQTAHRFAEDARRQLDGLPDSVAKSTLRDLTDFVVGRSL
jgi:octaprenyl-diphosphate synthase